MKIEKLSHEERVEYLLLPIMKVLQDAGGQLTRLEIQNRICEENEDIADYASIIKVSKKTGKEYREFDFKFNFALKDLFFAGLLDFQKRNPVVTLTEKGIDYDLNKFNKDEIIAISSKSWEELSNKNKSSKKPEEEAKEDIVESEVGLEDKYNRDFKNRLLKAISEMSPKKFEVFSRKLLSEMGVEFTEKGVQVSNDGGIDGYGYHRDMSDFRTTRVVIQCKRYNSSSVGEPEINQFLGAMSKYNADYGVFVTNSHFTKAAKIAAREGKPITLIDGNELVELVKKFEVYVKPVTTYELLDFYDENFIDKDRGVIDE